MSTLLSVAGLRITTGARATNRVLVRDMSLTLASGESIGLVGESGSGKSMTARAVMRLLPSGFDVEGEVDFDGTGVYAMSRTALRSYRSRDVAMIFQDPRAHTNPVRKVGDFMTEAMRSARGIPVADARTIAERMLGEVGIPEPARRMRQYPHELSGGMLQRVMIAAAFCREPRLLVADAPTTALDVTTQSDIMATVEGLRTERSLALLFITHDLELAAATCDRIAVMYAGTLVETGPAAVIEARPNHPYTVGLLRSRPPIDRRVERLDAIPGRPVSAHEAPPGCVFSARCALVIDRCRREAPLTRAVAGTMVACHRAEEVSVPVPAGAADA